VFGKSLTNGLNPLAGIWAAEELIAPDRWPPGSTHSTFGSNPFGMAGGLATFDWIATRDYQNSVRQKGEYLLARLHDLQRESPYIGDVDGLGLAIRVEMCFDDGLTPNRALAQAMKNAGLRGEIKTSKETCGLLLDIGGYYKNVFTLAPSLEISISEMDLFVELFAALLHEHTHE
jgi:4-aminobutyrate aminotransferase-like enzyme